MVTVEEIACMTAAVIAVCLTEVRAKVIGATDHLLCHGENLAALVEWNQFQNCQVEGLDPCQVVVDHWATMYPTTFCHQLDSSSVVGELFLVHTCSTVCFASRHLCFSVLWLVWSHRHKQVHQQVIDVAGKSSVTD
jgi:hypothetical protein